MTRCPPPPPSRLTQARWPLGGGQFASLRLDPLAKGKAQQLLDMEIEAPAGLAA